MRGRCKSAFYAGMGTRKDKNHHAVNRATYDREAEALSKTYNALDSEMVLPGLAQILPAADGSMQRRALDLGCGSGRDAFWLAATHGYDVVAVDASARMLAQARKDKAHPRVTYVRDMLPDLKTVRAQNRGKAFDAFVLSAVWMHMKPRERAVLAAHMAALAAPGAVAYISLRHGDAPADRPMFACPADEVEVLGRRHGAAFARIGGDRDRQGRGGVNWEYVTLRFP